MVALLLAVLVIGTASAVAAEYSEITADTMAVKGKSIESSVLSGNKTSTGIGAGENSTIETSNTSTELEIVENNASVTSENDSDAEVQLLDLNTTTNDQSTGADTQYLNVNPENDTIIAENETIPINTTGIVMQSTDYSCGPAALATVLNNLGINATEEELKILAGTDKTGTSMYGLAQAAKAKGLNAVGMMLSVNELKPGNIVYYIYGDINHYSIFTSINDTTVYLRDTFRGNFEMALADFTSAYIQDTAINYGYALVVTSDLTDPQLNNSNTLTNDEMKTVVGTGSAISTWTTGNARIRGIANWVVANYGRDPYSIGRGIFNWVDANIRWHNHKNTQYSVDTVLNKGLGNCCEQARLVVCIARAAGIPYFDVRYVHRPSAGHVWAQIRYSSAWNGWVDIDCSWRGSYYGFYMDRAVWRPYPNEGRNYYYALPF